MSKQIKVGDETYEKLKFLADEGHRPIGRQIDYLIDYYGGETLVDAQVTHINKSFEKAPPINNSGATPVVDPFIDDEEDPDPLAVIPRSPQDVLREKDALQAQLDEEKAANELNQDPDYWADFNTRCKQIDELWAEYHRLKGTK